MVQADFQFVLGQLLSDAALRQAFRENAAAASSHFALAPEDRAALLELSPDELDHQADILLRKRLDIIRHLIPITCARLGTGLWDHFAAFAKRPDARDEPSAKVIRLFRPDRDGHRTLPEAALAFLRELEHVCPEAVCAAEQNRFRFVASQARCRLHGITERTSGRWQVPALQVLWRWRGRWWEWIVRGSFGRR